HPVRVGGLGTRNTVQRHRHCHDYLGHLRLLPVRGAACALSAVSRSRPPGLDIRRYAQLSRVPWETCVRPLIIEVPSPLGLRPSGVERAPEALRAAGLHALLGCDDAVHVPVPPYNDRRDRATGVLNPDGIAEVARSLAGVT